MGTLTAKILPVHHQFAAICAFMALCTFPGALSGLQQPFLLLAPLVLIGCVQALMLFGRRPHFAVDQPLLFYLLLMGAIAVTGFIRGTAIHNVAAASSSASALIIISAQFLLAFVTCYLLSMTSTAHISKSMSNVLFWSASGMAALQILMLTLGIQHRAASTFLQTNSLSTSFEAIGVAILRWQAPLATGVNGGSLFFLFSGIAALALRRQLHGLVFCATLAISAFGLAAIDSRAAIAAFPCVMILSTALRSRPTLLATLAILIPAMPPVVLLSMEYIPSFLVDASQARASKFGMFAGRETIWGAVWHYYLINADWADLLFGAGYFGQVSTNLIARYNYIFLGFGESTFGLATLHNAYIQIVVDYGLVGVSVYALTIYRAVFVIATRASLEVRGHGVWRILLCFMLALLFSAGTEAVTTPYVKEGYSFFVGILLIAAMFGRAASGTIDLSDNPLTNNLHSRPDAARPPSVDLR